MTLNSAKDDIFLPIDKLVAKSSKEPELLASSFPLPYLLLARLKSATLAMLQSYSAKRCVKIGVADPGAVPGASTIFSCWQRVSGGGEIDSTCVIKGAKALGGVPLLSG